jgi:hypothetical protein
MRFALALPLAAAALVAGCNSEPAGPTVREQEEERARTAATLRGFDRAFGVPAETIAFANQFGFRAGDYAADGDSYLSRGNPIMLSWSGAERPNTGNFEAAGTSADRLERIAFTLSLTDAANAETARERFTTVIRDFLGRYQIDDEGALDAIAAERDADGMVAGTPMSIATASGEGDARTITVTFTRPAASTPAF